MNKIFLLLIVSNFIYSQNDIKLPDIEKNNFNTLHIPFHSIVLTNSNVILFDNDTIEIHELKYRLLSNYQNQPFDYTSTMGRLKNVHLFIDVDCKFRFFDRVFTEISSTVNPVVILRGNFSSTDNYNDVIGLKTKLPLSFYNFSTPKYRYTHEEMRKRNENEDSEFHPPLPPLTDNSLVINKKFKDLSAIFTLQQEVIDEYLQMWTYTCVNISNEGIFFRGRHFNYNDTSIWENIQANYDVIIVWFDKELLYSNYIQYVKNRPNNFNLMKDTNLEIIELTTEIRELHNRAKIRICER